MKRIITLMFLAIGFFCYSQNTSEPHGKDFVRDFYKNSVKVLIPDNGIRKHTFYFKDDKFYFEVQMDSRIAKEDVNDPEFRTMFKNGSVDIAYQMISKTYQIMVEGKGRNLLKEKGITEKIFINIYFSKYDLSNIEYLYAIDLDNLHRISGYFNKKDFESILEKRFY